MKFVFWCFNLPKQLNTWLRRAKTLILYKTTQRTLKNLLRTYYPYFLLFIMVVVSYHAISFFQYTFKWDMADQYFPWRYLVSEHLQASQLPLWNPYQDGGYPMHGDPQSGAWYPIVWILTFITGGYTLYTLHLEFILTIYIAAIGFYKLSQHFNYTAHTSILLAYAYCCSGFFVSNAQHFTWVISGAYLPFIFYYFLQTLHDPNYKNAIKTALSLFLILSGGYPAFIIIVSYVLLFLVAQKLYTHLKHKDYKKNLTLIYYQSVLCIVFLMTSSVVIYSILFCKPLITRGENVSMEAASFMPFSIPSFLSFVFPFATCHHSDFVKTDISMANAYIGIIAVVLFIVFLFRKNKTTLEKTFLTIGIVTLSASVGSALPVRSFLYEHVPLMNLFRFPSAFRIFFMISFLLLAGSELDKILGKHVLPKRLKTISILLFSVLILTLLLSIKKNYSGTGIYDYLFNRSFFNEHCTVYDHVIIQACLHLLILGTALVVWIKVKQSATSFKWILTGLIIADVLLAVNMNMKYTAVADDSNPTAIAHMLQKTPQGFPIPLEKIKNNSDTIQSLKPFWRNLNIFRKEIAFDGYNPFFLTSYATLEKSQLFDSTKNNRPVFLADKIINIDSYQDSNTLSPQHVYLNTAEYNHIQNHEPTPHTKDSISITHFTGNTITLKSNTAQERLMVVFQK